MPRYDADDGRCTVYTYKAGLLSAVGHDLAFRLTRWSLEVEEDRIEGHFDGTSLELLGVVRDGVPVPGVLSASDERQVMDNIRKYVFKGFRPAEIHFVAEDVEIDDDRIEGEGVLTIPPRSHAVPFEVEIDDGEARCSVRLHQPHWGIKPFSALMGTLKIKPDVEVRLTVPWDA